MFPKISQNMLWSRRITKIAKPISFSFFFLGGGGGGGIQVYTVMNGLNNIRSVADVTVQYVIRDQMTNIENIAVETGH